MDSLTNFGNPVSPDEIDLNLALQQAMATMTKQDVVDLLASIDPVSWTESRRILKGENFSFKNRDYLLQIYRDDYPHLFLMKGRQVEMSEFSMNWMLNRLDRFPYTAGLHAFPRAAQALKFSKQRLEFAIKDSQYIKDWCNYPSETMMRKFLKAEDERGLQPYNFYLLGGTWESKKDTVGDAARGTSLDFIIYDERQDHPDDVETVLGEGASHSDFKHTLTLGTPKLPGIQFDQQWEASDKHYWHVTCEHCGYTAPITMDNIMDSGENPNYPTWYYGCPKCGKPLNRNNGKWLATQPQYKPEFRGYHINQLMVCWLTADEIMAKKNSTKYSKRRFANEVLGESYGGDDIPITNAMMMACADNDYRLGQLAETEKIYAGVDWGAKSYLYIQNKQHRLIDLVIADHTDNREHPKVFARHIAKYKKFVKRVVCDAGPDISNFNNLKDELKEVGISPKIVYACYYASPPAKTEISINEEKQIITAGRSEAIDHIIDEIHDCRMALPGANMSMEIVDTCITHFCNIAAEHAETASGQAYIMYVNTGPDHFLHAKIYCDIASGGIDPSVLAGTAGKIETKGNGTNSRNTHKFPHIYKSERRKSGRHSRRRR